MTSLWCHWDVKCISFACAPNQTFLLDLRKLHGKNRACSTMCKIFTPLTPHKRYNMEIHPNNCPQNHLWRGKKIFLASVQKCCRWITLNYIALIRESQISSTTAPYQFSELNHFLRMKIFGRNTSSPPSNIEMIDENYHARKRFIDDLEAVVVSVQESMIYSLLPTRKLIEA